MPTPCYLIELDGQGDTSLLLVTKEIFDWITREDTPGREGHESGWIDSAVPETVLEQIRKDSARWGLAVSDKVHVTSGSYQNDRALNVPSSAAIASFHSTKEMLTWLQDKEFVVVDTWEGYLY